YYINPLPVVNPSFHHLHRYRHNFHRRSATRISEMPFKRYVEIGRIALVNYGKDYGKLVVIVDVIDQNRIPKPGWIFCSRLLWLFQFTDQSSIIITVKYVKNKWESSSWGRKLIVQKKRASLNDFDRFKVMLAKIKKAGVIRQELANLKKQTTA
ncbi:Ribosomal protein L14, partial [Cynara cardunculus var. scolymus]